MEWVWIVGGLLLYIVFIFPDHIFRVAKELWLTWTGQSPNIRRKDI